MNNEATERDLLVLELMALAYAVDRQTPYAVFIEYSGHVEGMDVKIVKSKDNWQSEIASTEFYVTGKYQPDGTGWLKAKRDHLKSILETHEVDVSAMDEVVERVVTHAF